MSVLPRIMIAAPKSGSGKTLVTCALCLALKEKGKKVASVKCGPDYIDPMFHREVLKTPSYNLDTFFTDENVTRTLFIRECSDSDIAVFEGVMGLFDGVGGVELRGSSYDLARVCKVPVILVVDTKGTARSVIPTILGFLAYDKEELIKGIILNNMSSVLYKRMVPLFEKELPVPVLGFFPKDERLFLKSRHLGLVMPNEVTGIKEKLEYGKEQLLKSVDVDRILEIAERKIESLPEESEIEAPDSLSDFILKNKVPKGSVNIAVAMDRAFCFYYEENLWLLKELGARLTFFSPMEDECLPKGINGVIFGGGYPEIFAKELSGNVSMLKSVKTALDAGLPVLAECGGFMYLHEELEDEAGKMYPMVGYVPGKTYYTGRKIRFGYGEFSSDKSDILKSGNAIKGHEFHYFESDNPGEDLIAKKPGGSDSYRCGHAQSRNLIGFPHFYYPSNPKVAGNFLRWCKG